MDGANGTAEGTAKGRRRPRATVAGGGTEAAPLPALRPAQCREYMRRELAREFRGIVQGFVAGAKKGSCQHVKLATELVGTPARRRRASKSTVLELIEQLESKELENGRG